MIAFKFTPPDPIPLGDAVALILAMKLRDVRFVCDEATAEKIEQECPGLLTREASDLPDEAALTSPSCIVCGWPVTSPATQLAQGLVHEHCNEAAVEGKRWIKGL